MKLEEIAKGAQISGIEPGKVVRVVSADPLGDNAVIQRAVRANCDQLKFKNRDFGEG